MREILKQKIIEASQEIGIDKIGFTSAQHFSHLKDSLEEQKAMGHTTGFEHPNIEERLFPEKIFSEPKTIISLALAYPTKIHEKAPKSRVKRGSFARASWGTDYHEILNEKMKQLILRIEEITAEFYPRFKPMVDTGELIDVVVAERAGLGFIGKNGLLITEEFGSFVYLGEIITNLVLTPDEPKKNGCGECTRCIDQCPTSALLGDGRMNATRCLSYQTQTKGYMPEEYRKKIRTTIYGCDICQLVCPYNKGKDFHFHKEMEPKIEEVQPELLPLLTISNKEFKARFGHLAGSWRGKKPIQRNAIIALANANDRGAIPALLQLMAEDTRPVIRGTAAWAVGQLERLPNEEERQFFEQLLSKESDEETKKEYQQVLNKWL
ncbi:MAG: tRNA epoxyqueuosine(34) reductase QueG [Lactobacillales bacterium]|jgi:epoxyqueuosine reductase|nr:tRNA epoxyqueuosine(34) reductase QueG [Lactobacillales bacterium]